MIGNRTQTRRTIQQTKTIQTIKWFLKIGSFSGIRLGQRHELKEKCLLQIIYIGAIIYNHDIKCENRTQNSYPKPPNFWKFQPKIAIKTSTGIEIRKQSFSESRECCQDGGYLFYRRPRGWASDCSCTNFLLFLIEHNWWLGLLVLHHISQSLCRKTNRVFSREEKN